MVNRQGLCTSVLFINPQRTCAARATVVFLCLCVGVSLCLSEEWGESRTTARCASAISTEWVE